MEVVSLLQKKKTFRRWTNSDAFEYFKYTLDFGCQNKLSSTFRAE